MLCSYARPDKCESWDILTAAERFTEAKQYERFVTDSAIVAVGSRMESSLAESERFENVNISDEEEDEDEDEQEAKQDQHAGFEFQFSLEQIRAEYGGFASDAAVAAEQKQDQEGDAAMQAQGGQLGKDEQ